jgi:hypothetical protein
MMSESLTDKKFEAAYKKANYLYENLEGIQYLGVNEKDKIICIGVLRGYVLEVEEVVGDNIDGFKIEIVPTGKIVPCESK